MHAPSEGCTRWIARAIAVAVSCWAQEMVQRPQKEEGGRSRIKCEIARGCWWAPDPDDDRYAGWVLNHKCLENTDCNAGRMEAEAAPILFSGEELAALHEGIYGCSETEQKDCLCHVRMGETLVEKAQGETRRKSEADPGQD
ncbi:hypothetical protein HPB47_011436 [Ixodes persulcatus]|uniref:Uncharacterized protein n=1 Tax=Ixodes persulcatus TaxID=34615 RepID=A0AC60NWD6_IXOPE|nr:hypothetical protein HPB47_011436 [Ixodes persulcatus]